MPERKISRGHAIVEYILPLALIAVGAGLLFWGGDMQGIIGGVVSGAVKGQVQEKTLQVSQWGRFPPPTDARNFKNAVAGFEELCFSQPSVCLSVPIVDPDKLDTVGSLGGDGLKNLALLLEGLPKLLEALGVDPDVVAKVTDLANKGHALGEKLSAIQAMCPGKEVCSPENVAQAKAELAALKTTELNDFLAQWQELQDFVKAYPDAFSKFPQAYGIIEGQVKSIKDMIASLSFLDVNTKENTAYLGQTTKSMSYSGFSTFVNALDNRTLVTVNGSRWWKTVDAEGNYQLNRWVNNILVTQKYDYTAAENSTTFSADAETIGDIHQDANTICQNGGQITGTGNCMRQVEGGEFEPI